MLIYQQRANDPTHSKLGLGQSANNKDSDKTARSPETAPMCSFATTVAVTTRKL